MSTADPWHRLVPLPLAIDSRQGSLPITAGTRIVVDGDLGEHDHIVGHLVADVQRATGHSLRRGDAAHSGDIVLELTTVAGEHGAEGYELVIDEHRATVRAVHPHGLWNGTRSLVQLLPDAQHETAFPLVRIVDRPRFEWRGAMLDVARHFFGPADIMRFIEVIARFKLNRLHLHLTDDQGWRIAIDGWPELTTIGARSAVGGGPGGWFTRDDYRAIVAHAARHFVTVVPELDMPGHTNAALASVPDLNVSGVSPAPYHDEGVGFSSLRMTAAATRSFIADVIGQLAADTPGDYLHIGGDEAHVTDQGEYLDFIDLLHREVRGNGKRMIGWEEIAQTALVPGTLVQHWLTPELAAMAPNGTRFVMSPARHTYLDMKHTRECRPGRRWAGFIDIDTAYLWDPARLIEGVGDDRIAGVEAALWTERVTAFDDVEYLCFPRLVCLAEVGWTAQRLRDWDRFRPRVAVQAEWLAGSGVHLHRSVLLAPQP